MEWLTGIAGYVIPFLVVLTVLVFVHEFGHYWVARRNGVKVEVFSIGFGPEIFGWTNRAGTRWRVSALPLGGYVKMLGDMDAASRPDDPKLQAMTDAEREEAFPYKSLHAKAWIVAAGPLANFLLAIVLLTVLFIAVGRPAALPVVGAVVPGSAAEAAGLQPGDRFLTINGKEIKQFQDLRRLVMLNLERPLSVVVERDGQPIELTMRPVVTVEQDSSGCEVRVPRIGVQSGEQTLERYGPFEAVGAAATETWDIVSGSLFALWQIITGERSTDDLGGPLRIAELSGQAASFGFANLVLLLALISVNLGLINLFPIPMLDGGHLLFYGIEAVRGRPLGQRAQEYGFKIGIALVLSLMLFATINDIVRIDDCVSAVGG